MCTPYTYLIGWSNLNLWYYGAKWADGCHPSDLWVKYFTSSTKVSDLRRTHGEPDVVQVRKVFNDKFKARMWEFRVINKIGAIKSDKWLNRGNGGLYFGLPDEAARKKIGDRSRGRKQTDEMKQRLSMLFKGRPGPVISEEAKQRMRDLRKGIPRDQSVVDKLRIANTGKKQSDETIRKRVEKNVGKTRSEETKNKMREAWARRKLDPPMTNEQKMNLGKNFTSWVKRTPEQEAERLRKWRISMKIDN